MKLYSPRVLAAYFILGNLPIGTALLAINLSRRGERRTGVALFVMAAVGLALLLMAAMSRRRNLLIAQALGVIGGVLVMYLEREPFKAAVESGATTAKWWPPALVLMAIIVLAVIFLPFSG